MKWLSISIGFTALAFGIISLDKSNSESQKINGVNFVGTSTPIDSLSISNLQSINANWVAFNPYGFCSVENPKIEFNSDWQWWGEKTEGIETCIKYAKVNQLKIMLKPHIWVKNQGWAGELEFSSEQDWLLWEKSYTNYITHFAAIAEKHNIELFCIGTEIKKSVTSRKKFWTKLIDKIKKIYHGKLVYASNWDNYKNIPFWEKLDYIGVDAYFPICNDINPTSEQLNFKWKKITNELNEFSTNMNKKIIFTEYGYRSTIKCAGKHWEILDDGHNYSKNVDLQSQSKAYLALYENCWNKKWLQGGFIWKWYPNKNEGGLNNSDFTPQNKPVEKIIKQFYKN